MMGKRFLRTAQWVGWVLVFSLGGFFANWAFFAGTGIDVERLRSASHGLIGALYGVLFIVGGGLVSIFYWIVTGQSIIDKILWPRAYDSWREEKEER